MATNPNKLRTESFDILKVKPVFYAADTGFYIARTDKGTIVVNGAIIPIQGNVKALGEWVVDKKFGKQFKARRVFFTDPQSAIQVMFGAGFLHGIKQAKAENLLVTLGERVFEVLNAAVDGTKVSWNDTVISGKTILLMVSGIGKVNVEEILESWKERRETFEYLITATMAGLTVKQFKTAEKLIGLDDMKDWILNNPYKLSILPGFSWDDVDAINDLVWEGKTPLPHNSTTRLYAALREVIERHSFSGHMAMPWSGAIIQAGILSDTDKNFLWNAVKDGLADEGLLAFNIGDEAMITTEKSYRIEYETAEMLVALATAKPRYDKAPADIDVSKFSDLNLAEKQKEAIKMALANNVSVITGGPGMGKTTILKVVLDILDKYGISYTLCAPTGKASRRMQESTGRKAATLHRELHIGGDPLMMSTDYLFIDEWSMGSASMQHQVLKLIPLGCSVVFIGDADQLPPVSAGEPLMQMLESGIIASTRLDVIYRQGANSGIISAAHDIINGRIPQTSDSKDFIVENVNGQGAFPMIQKYVNYLASLGIRRDDIAILTSVNTGDLGRQKLNWLMQEYYNPNGQRILNSKLRVGDRVIQLKNTYELGEEGIMNGQTGIVIAAGEGKSISDIFDKKNDDDEVCMIVEFDGEVVGVTEDQSATIELANALTVHKTQGSQFRAVIFVVPLTRDSHMTRQLLYTGVTRAAEFCFCLVQGQAMQAHVGNEVKLRRFSMLGHLINVYAKEHAL